MKDKGLYFIIGLLVGAILTTGVFMLINKNNSSSNNNRRGNNGNGVMNQGPMRLDPDNPPEGAEVIIGPNGEKSIRMQHPDGGQSGGMMKAP